MKRMTMTAVALAASMGLAGSAAGSDDLAEAVRAMQDRLDGLEQKLEATTDELEAAEARVAQQENVIREAGLTDARGASSGLASFLETVEIGGWVAGSYFYNFGDPDGTLLGGANSGTAALYPFHPDANSFSLDQLWFEIGKAATEDSRAGFYAEIAYGKTAGILSGVTAGDGISGNDFDVYAAYIEYLAAIGEGVTFKAGKFGTLIGAEVAQSPYNLNITRGHVYNLFQPITHTGVLASTELNGVSINAGFVNETRSFDAADVDLNKNKAFLWSLGFGGDVLALSLAGVHGASDSGQGVNTDAGDKENIFDLILSWNPSDEFTGYVNADYIDSENSDANADVSGFGIAVAGRLALSEVLGVALRGEYVDLEFDGAGLGGSDADNEIWGLTGTVDYALTEKLLVRGELRYDDYGSSDDPFENVFVDEDVFDESDQLTAGVELIYSF